MKLKFFPHSTALVILDMQKDFFAPEGISAIRGRKVSSMQLLPGKINSFISRISHRVKLIIFTQYVSGKDITPPNLTLVAKANEYSLLCEKGLTGAAFEGIDIPPDALVIQKPHYDAFAYTNLKEVLKKKKIRNVFVCGVRTEVCVEATAKRAASEGFNTIIIRDLVATYDDKQQLHQEILGLFQKYYGFVMTSNEVIKSLQLQPE